MEAWAWFPRKQYLYLREIYIWFGIFSPFRGVNLFGWTFPNLAKSHSVLVLFYLTLLHMAKSFIFRWQIKVINLWLGQQKTNETPEWWWCTACWRYYFSNPIRTLGEDYHPILHWKIKEYTLTDVSISFPNQLYSSLPGKHILPLADNNGKEKIKCSMLREWLAMYSSEPYMAKRQQHTLCRNRAEKRTLSKAMVKHWIDCYGVDQKKLKQVGLVLQNTIILLNQSFSQ